MSEKNANELLDKYFEGRASDQEIKKLESYADQLLSSSDFRVFESDAEKEKLRAEILESIKIEKRSTALPWFRIAASVVVFFGLSTAVWFMGDSWFGPEYVAVSTGVGETKEIKLEDGTMIHLNAVSTLEYPNTFDRDERNVRLTGEALFNVSKDAERPFTVETGEVTTTVLGTIFNVDAYKAQSSISVSLLEGSVRVNGVGITEIIQPGEQANFDLTEGSMEVASFDVSAILAWQDGDVVLDNNSFKDVASVVSRKYGVDIKFDRPEIANFKVSGRFQDPELQTLMESICAAKALKYKKVDDNTILVY